MLKTRAITAAILVPVFLAALFLLPDIVWAILSLAIMVMATWEWAGLMGASVVRKKSYTALTLLTGIALLVLLEFGHTQPMEYALFWGMLASVFFWLALAPIWLTTRFPIKNFWLMAIIGWLVLMPTWFALLALKISPLLALVDLQGTGSYLLLGIIAVVWVADSAAYFFGKRFGKYKLAPRISPGKTWEGVLGAWLAVSIYGGILCTFLHMNYWLIVALWGVTVLSIMGDLLESMIKRHAGVKDSGQLLPGHGGILDRIDGLTSSLPLAAFFIYFPIYYRVWSDYVPA